MRLSGKVIDATTGEPIEGTMVTINGRRIFTGAGGGFGVEAPKGSYRISVEHKDYTALTRTISLAKPTSFTLRMMPILKPLKK